MRTGSPVKAAKCGVNQKAKIPIGKADSAQMRRIFWRLYWPSMAAVGFSCMVRGILGKRLVDKRFSGKI